MQKGCNLQAQNNEVLELSQATVSYSIDLHDRMQVSECVNKSQNNVAFEWYHTYFIYLAFCVSYANSTYKL